MKIGILTFHCAINYGAVLQAYGLQTFLQFLGHDVYIIDYRPDYLTRSTRALRFNEISYKNAIQYLQDFLRECMVIPIRIRRNLLFNKFQSKYLCLKELELSSHNCDIDLFILGSDQIWNPALTNGYDEIFFGKFQAACGKKLISYAASCGSIENIKDNLSFYNYLKIFSSVSVRESSLKNYIDKEFNNLSVQICLDPVLLAGKEVYNRIADDVTITKDYILLFQLNHDETVFRNALELSVKYGMELIEITPYTESLKNKYIINGVSPSKLLGYIKNATYIMTSSYHGVVLSILFRKNFNAFLSDKSKSERIVDLLNSLNLSDRITNYVNDISPIKYSIMEDNYSKLLQLSRQYIASAL